MAEIGIDGICIICGNLTKHIRSNRYICPKHNKAFWEDYWCASPYWKTCQLDCGDCSMLRHLDDHEADIQHKINMEEIERIERQIGIEWFGKHGKK